MMKSRALFFLVFLHLSCLSFSQNLSGGGEANPNLLTNKTSLERWQDLRFGLFVHWDPVALRGTEIGWSRGREVSFDEYDALYQEFNPVLFDADAWVDMIKKAGMKYIIVVSKHHDGFVMWDSKTTDYDIMSTPFKRDVLKELSVACKKQGILFGTYHSICDWHHPDYPVVENGENRPNANMQEYIKYLKAQLKELVEVYGTEILWFDGEWEDPWTHEMGMDLYKYLREMNETLLINNRVDKGRKGMEGVSASARFAGDFATPEQTIGKYDPVTPWESCITICKQWAWKPNDILKSKKECIQTLVQTVGGDGNLLLNVGPMMDGRVEQRQIERLHEIGDWLEQYGETIYGTRGGPFAPGNWGVSTQKGDKIYLHILNNKESKLQFDNFSKKVRAINVYGSDKAMAYSIKKNRLEIELPELPDDLIDLIVEIEIK